MRLLFTRRQCRVSRSIRKRHFMLTCLQRRAFRLLLMVLAPHALVKALVVAGDQAQVEQRLRELIASGLDELLLMLVPVA